MESHRNTRSSRTLTQAHLSTHTILPSPPSQRTPPVAIIRSTWKHLCGLSLPVGSPASRGTACRARSAIQTQRCQHGMLGPTRYRCTGDIASRARTRIASRVHGAKPAPEARHNLAQAGRPGNRRNKHPERRFTLRRCLRQRRREVRHKPHT